MLLPKQQVWSGKLYLIYLLLTLIYFTLIISLVQIVVHFSGIGLIVGTSIVEFIALLKDAAFH